MGRIQRVNARYNLIKMCEAIYDLEGKVGWVNKEIHRSPKVVPQVRKAKLYFCNDRMEREGSSVKPGAYHTSRCGNINKTSIF